MVRCCTCRQRTRTCRTGVAPGSTMHSVRTDERSETVALGYGRDEHAELPADLVLAGRGAVRVEHVALVEHGVGDGACAGEAITVGAVASLTLLSGFLEQHARASRPTSAGPLGLEARQRVERGAADRTQPLFGK